MDVGCCFGTDLRVLAHDGIPSHQLIGMDIENEFIELGYELFCDRESFNGRFSICNILKEELGHTRKLGDCSFGINFTFVVVGGASGGLYEARTINEKCAGGYGYWPTAW